MALTNNSPNTILLDVGSSSKLMEGIVTTGQNILPGELCQVRMTTGTIERYHNASLQLAPVLIAVENTAAGLGVDDVYLQLTKIFYVHMRPGDLFWGRVTAAAVEVGEAMGAETATGYLQPTTGYVPATTQGTYDEAIAFIAEADALTTGGRLVKIVTK